MSLRLLQSFPWRCVHERPSRDLQNFAFVKALNVFRGNECLSSEPRLECRLYPKLSPSEGIRPFYWPYGHEDHLHSECQSSEQVTALMQNDNQQHS